MEDKVNVITNHLGYRNGHGKKHVLVTDVPDARSIFGDSIFTVFEQNNFSKYGLNDPRQIPHIHRASLNRIHTDFQTSLIFIIKVFCVFLSSNYRGEQSYDTAL
ncbi:MAG: hypothetical protein WCO98_03350 [bacterium]